MVFRIFTKNRDFVKIVVFPMENCYFQGFGVRKYHQFLQNCPENGDVFWDFNFGGISGRFGKGFGNPKSLIFRFFRFVFRSITWTASWRDKKLEKNGGGAL